MWLPEIAGGCLFQGTFPLALAPSILPFPQESIPLMDLFANLTCTRTGDALRLEIANQRRRPDIEPGRMASHHDTKDAGTGTCIGVWR